jgi:hypothetical protein
MDNGSMAAHGENVRVRRAPYGLEVLGGRGRQAAPRPAVIIEDRAVVAGSENMGTRVDPDSVEGVPLGKGVLPLPFRGQTFPGEKQDAPENHTEYARKTFGLP